MTDRLDDLIREIQETSQLRAEIRNQLHGCLSTHPWGRNKDFATRKRDAIFAVAQSGRAVHAKMAYSLERINE